MWLRALNAITGAVLEDGLNVFLVADVVAPAISCAVPRDRPVLIDVEVIEI
jgi:TPP-dependent pyruvate/acetoin dehydrogenase alpha subunit